MESYCSCLIPRLLMDRGVFPQHACPPKILALVRNIESTVKCSWRKRDWLNGGNYAARRQKCWCFLLCFLKYASLNVSTGECLWCVCMCMANRVGCKYVGELGAIVERGSWSCSADPHWVCALISSLSHFLLPCHFYHSVSCQSVA